jgi:hypothetical protein
VAARQTSQIDWCFGHLALGPPRLLELAQLLREMRLQTRDPRADRSQIAQDATVQCAHGAVQVTLRGDGLGELLGVGDQRRETRMQFCFS